MDQAYNYQIMKVAFRMKKGLNIDDDCTESSYTDEYAEKFRNRLSDEHKKIYDNYYILYIMQNYFFGSKYDNIKPTLFVNKNCNSCSILGHQNLLELQQYNIIQTADIINVPRLEDGDNKYIGIELMRKLYQNININDITDEKLEKMIENDHRNCIHE